MRVVVADTGPLHYLVLIDAVELLPRLFGHVFIPTIVHAELLHPEAPPLVRAWAEAPPPWLTILPAPMDDDTDSRSLDDGERAAIALSGTLRADLILMDDRAGVAAARGRGFAVTGTLGLLVIAARKSLIDLGVAFTALRSTNFHVRARLLDELLARHQSENGQ